MKTTGKKTIKIHIHTISDYLFLHFIYLQLYTSIMMIRIFKGCFIKMSSFLIHWPRNLDFTRSFIPIYIVKVYTEGFVYISFTVIYVTFYFLKHKRYFFILAADSIFWFMEWWIIHGSFDTEIENESKHIPINCTFCLP